MTNFLKKSLLGLSILFTVHSSQAQFMHGYGATISYMLQDGEYILFTNLTYAPRLVFGAKESSSFSFGIPVSAGVGLVNDGYGGIYYGGEVPAIVDVNFGRKSSPENEDRFGWFFGAGFSYRFSWLSDGEVERLHSYGPMLRVGMRLGNSRDNPNKTMSILLSVKQGLEQYKWKTIGLGVIQEF